MSSTDPFVIFYNIDRSRWLSSDRPDRTHTPSFLVIEKKTEMKIRLNLSVTKNFFKEKRVER